MRDRLNSAPLRDATEPAWQALTFAMHGDSSKHSRLVVVRPITPNDGEGLHAFVQAMSPNSRSDRFHGGLAELSSAMLEGLTHVDQTNHVAFVAQHCENSLLIGEARYAVDANGEKGECAVAVADACQGQGLGTFLLEALIHAACRAGLMQLEGEVRYTNMRMRSLATRLGFAIQTHPEPNKVRNVRQCM